jgi:predicted nucleic acid-binding protein
MNALDTNIWLYCHDTRDALKQATAQSLVASTRPLALPWQVGCEFVAATRKLSSVGFTEAQAWDSLALMRAMADATVLPEPDDWTEARSLQGRHVLSFWDALLVAAYLRSGIAVLFTEDMGTPRTIDSLELVNPFLLSPTP